MPDSLGYTPKEIWEADLPMLFGRRAALAELQSHTVLAGEPAYVTRKGLARAVAAERRDMQSWGAQVVEISRELHRGEPDYGTPGNRLMGGMSE